MAYTAHYRMVVKIKATSAITDLIGSGNSARVYPALRHRDTTLPALTYQRISVNPVNASVGTSGTAFETIQVNCLASTYDGAWALSDVVEAALQGWTDTGGTPPVSMCHLTDKGDLPQDILGGQEVPEYGVRHDYLLQYATA